MISQFDRRLLRLLMACKVVRAHSSLFRTTEFRAVRGFGWVLDGIRKRQKIDDLKHAPCCPANHFHRKRIVFQRCTCGAAESHRIYTKYAKEGASE